MRLAAFVLIGALVGCGSKHADPAQACADAAKQGVDAMINQARGRLAGAQLPDDVRARMMERQKRLEGAGGKMRAVFTNRCVDDKWTSTVLACYRKVTSLEEMRACRRQLTPEQQAKLQKDELDMLSGVAGPPGLDQSQPGGPFVVAVDPRITMINKAINDAMKEVADAKTDAERETAKAQLATLQAEKKQLEEQVAHSIAPEAIAALEKEVADARAKVDAMQAAKHSDKDRAVANNDYLHLKDQLESTKKQAELADIARQIQDIERRASDAAARVAAATAQADRDAATQQLEALQKEHDALEAKFKAIVEPPKP